MLFAFSKKDIISPASGVWANVQPLVLNVSNAAELYYSLTGSDPYESGFAYDGPIVIDETGDIEVKITSISKDGKREDFSVKYTVCPVTYKTNNPDTAVFIQNLSLNPIRKYVSGSSFSLPEGFMYSLTNEELPYLKENEISLSQKNSLERYIPCSVSDSKIAYHFVIHIVPENVLPNVQKELPFKIIDWETFVFTGNKLIYQIDDEFWNASKEPLKLDRSVSHVVRWQSIAYEEGNPVESFILPSKPSLAVSYSKENYVEISLAESDDASSYLLGSALLDNSNTFNSAKISSSPSKKLYADAFYGDNLSEEFDVGLYCSGLYQGSIKCSAFLDKQPSVPPSIEASFEGEYSRSAVTISIKSLPAENIFYAVSKPLISESGFSKLSDSLFDSVINENYSLYDGKPFTLVSKEQNATYYKVNAFSVDEAGNKSLLSEYSVIVDEYNYYLDETSSSVDGGDGSIKNPFTSFRRALGVINSRDYTRLFITGDVSLESGTAVIKKNCVLLGNESRVVFSPLSCVRVENSDVTLESCILEKHVSSVSGVVSENESVLRKHLLWASGGSLNIKDCEIVGVFENDGILLESENSKINIVNSGLTVQSFNYACNFSSSNAELNVSSSRITSIASTALNFSLTGGTCCLNNLSTMVIGRIGRAVELSGVEASLSDNEFSASLENENHNLSAVWKDVDSVIVLNSGNNESGF